MKTNYCYGSGTRAYTFVINKCLFQHPKYWMSLVWAGAIVTRYKNKLHIFLKLFAIFLHNFPTGISLYGQISEPQIQIPPILLYVHTVYRQKNVEEIQF